MEGDMKEQPLMVKNMEQVNCCLKMEHTIKVSSKMTRWMVREFYITNLTVQPMKGSGIMTNFTVTVYSLTRKLKN